MKAEHSKRTISLFAKFAFVSIVVGIVPIILLVTLMQGSLLEEYRASLEATYQEALAYSTYSIKARLDGYSKLSQFCYFYNNSPLDTFTYDYFNYDKLHQILTGEAFAGQFETYEEIQQEKQREMTNFLHNLNRTNSNIAASHFVYQPEGALEPTLYHKGNYSNVGMLNDVFLSTVDYESIDKTKKTLLLIPPHYGSYIQTQERGKHLYLTVGRNYYDLSYAVGREKYLGTLFIDVRITEFDLLLSDLALTKNGVIYVTDQSGNCYFSSDETMVGQIVEAGQEESGALSLSSEIPAYGLTVRFSQRGLSIEEKIEAMQRVIFLVVLLSLLVLLISSLFFSGQLTKPIRVMMQHMADVETGNFHNLIHITSNDEMGLLTARFNRMSEELDRYTKQVYLSRIKQTEAELNALKSQIYPPISSITRWRSSA